jgi:GNAT superfamily N-acetyltransferase
VDLAIRPIGEDELGGMLAEMHANYVSAIVADGGFDRRTAEEKATADNEAVFPGGRPTPDVGLYALEVGGARIGRLCIAERPEILHRGALWILELFIDEAHRGHGYGRRVLKFAEEEAARRGLDRLALNVWAGNEVARNLYREVGFRENAVLLSKSLYD